MLRLQTLVSFLTSLFLSSLWTVHQEVRLIPAPRSPISGLWLNRRVSFRDGDRKAIVQWPSTDSVLKPEAETGEGRGRAGGGEEGTPQGRG